MKYFFGGVNGSGKTTLLLKIKEARPEFEIIKGSRAFMTLLGIRGSYETLRRLPHEYKLGRLSEMMETILKRHENMITDGHYLNLVRGKTTSVTGDWVKRFDALLLLKVSPETALQRISKELRDRALFPEGMSKEQEYKMYGQYIMEYEKEFQKLTDKWHLPAKILDGEKSVDEIVREFIAFDKSLRQQE